MSIFGSGGGPGNRLSFTGGGHHRPSPRGKRKGCAGGAQGVRGGWYFAIRVPWRSDILSILKINNH